MANGRWFFDSIPFQKTDAAARLKAFGASTAEEVVKQFVGEITLWESAGADQRQPVSQ